MHKNNPQMYSPQQIKKAVMTAAYFKVKKRQLKMCFRCKTEKVNTTIEFCIFDLDSKCQVLA